MYNDETIKRFDSTWIGWYMGFFAYFHPVRTAKFDLKVGPGMHVFFGDGIAEEFDFYTLTLAACATARFGTFGVFARADMMPVRSRGMELSPLPGMLRAGFEFSFGGR